MPRERYIVETCDNGQWRLSRENGEEIGIFPRCADALEFLVNAPPPKPDLRLVKTTACDPCE